VRSSKPAVNKCSKRGGSRVETGPEEEEMGMKMSEMESGI
jgi:hypothetical protein